jgi:RNA polymerase sigma factor (sigma-70 family)
VISPSQWPPASPEGPYTDLESLVRATYKDCCRAAFRILGNEADAEDSTQSAYAKLTLNWARVSGFETAERQCAYLFKMVTNEARQIIRTRDRRPEYVDTEMGENLLVAEYVEEQVQAREDLRLVVRVMDELPVTCRRVIMLYTAGYEYREIAKRLSINVSTVRSHISNAREYLQKALLDIAKGERR